MSKKNSFMFLLLPLLTLLFQPCYSTTILVDGVSAWKNPSVHVGDSVIFKHKYHYNLYIFQNQRAFNLCNFTQSSLLTKSNSTSYTWHPSRPGFYYYTFSNGSLKSCNQSHSQKLSIKVSLSAPPPAEVPPVAAPIPEPVSGGEVSSSPAYPWPFRPRETAFPPAPVPSSSGGGANSPMTVPTVVPADKGGSMPFINSNPAVPLPTGEVDSATIRPLSTSAHHQQVAIGLLGPQMAVFCVVLLLLL